MSNTDFIYLLLHNNTDEYSCLEMSFSCPDLCMFACSACMTKVKSILSRFLCANSILSAFTLKKYFLAPRIILKEINLLFKTMRILFCRICNTVAMEKNKCLYVPVRTLALIIAHKHTYITLGLTRCFRLLWTSKSYRLPEDINPLKRVLLGFSCRWGKKLNSVLIIIKPWGMFTLQVSLSCFSTPKILKRCIKFYGIHFILNNHTTPTVNSTKKYKNTILSPRYALNKDLRKVVLV